MYLLYCATRGSDKAFVCDEGTSLEDAVKEAEIWADEISEEDAPVQVCKMQVVAEAQRVSNVKVTYF